MDAVDALADSMAEMEVAKDAGSTSMALLWELC